MPSVAEAATQLEDLIAQTEESLAQGTLTAAQVTALRQATKALRQARRDALTSIQPLPPAIRPEAVYDLSGRLLPSPRHGLNIIRQADGTVRKEMR